MKNNIEILGFSHACSENNNFINAMMNIEQYSQMLIEYSVIYRPKIYKDGNMWCALYGENIQEGIAGFGKNPNEALCNYNKAWFENIKE
jgi:hypothetical protein